MSYDEFVSDVVQVVEAVGAAIMVVGAVGSLVYYTVAALRADDRAGIYDRLRRVLGRVILLGLEILIIADIVRTIIVDPTLESVGVLGLIVVIRIVLSFSLEVEMYGAWPWSRWRLEQRKVAAGDPTSEHGALDDLSLDRRDGSTCSGEPADDNLVDRDGEDRERETCPMSGSRARGPRVPPRVRRPGVRSRTCGPTPAEAKVARSVRCPTRTGAPREHAARLRLSSRWPGMRRRPRGGQPR